MIEEISWPEIEKIWKKKLWPNRITPIEPTSAMCFLGDYDMNNMIVTPTFFGYFVKGKLVGVNSGHQCPKSNSYRSRGLWVDPKHRGKGIGKILLNVTIAEGFNSGHNMIWSYPRKSSWSTYKSVGFKLESKWKKSETSEMLGSKAAGLPEETLNAYCSISQK